jgi:hypothetical protein
MDPFWLRKITPDPHPSHVNMECADDRYPKLKTGISKLSLDSNKYIPVAYVTLLHDLTLIKILNWFM